MSESSPILDQFKDTQRQDDISDAEIRHLEAKVGLRESPDAPTRFELEEQQTKNEIEKGELEKLMEEANQQEVLPQPKSTGQAPPSNNQEEAPLLEGVDTSTPGYAITLGAARAIEGVINTGIDTFDYIENFLADQGLGSGDIVDQGTRMDFTGKVFPKPVNTEDQVIAAGTEFLLTFAGLSKVFKGVNLAVKGGQAIKAAGMGAAVDLMAFDPDEEKISDLVSKDPFYGQFIPDFLVADDDDHPFERRLKNVAEGAALGLGIDGLMTGVAKATKIYKARRAAVSAKGEYKKLKDAVAKGEDYIPPKVEATPEQVKISQKIDETIAKPKGKVYDAGKVDFDSIDTDADLELAIKESRKNLGNSEVLTDEQTVAEAVAKMQDPEEVKRLLGKKKGDAINGSDLVAMRGIQQQAWENLNSKITKLAKDNSDVARAEFMEAQLKFFKTSEAIKGIKGTSGHTLRSNRIIFGNHGAEKRAAILSDMIKHYGGAENIDDMAKFIAKINNTGDKVFEFVGNQWVKKSGTKRFGEWFLDTWRNFLLSRPVTHARNMVSNSLVALNYSAEKGVASMFRPVGDGSAVVSGEGLATLRGMGHSVGNQGLNMFQGIAETFKLSAKSSETFGDDLYKKVAKEVSKNSANKIKNVSALSTVDTFDIQNESIRDFANMMDKIRFAPMKALGVVDNFFKHVNVTGELFALAHRDAVEKGFVRGSKEYDQAVKLFLDDPPDLQSPMGVAEINTFTNDIVPGFMKDIEKLLRGEAQTELGAYGKAIGKVFFPFVTTPLNIAAYTLERTPLPLIAQQLDKAGISTPVFRQFKSDMLAGGARRQMAQARVTLGTTVITTGMLLANNEVITGDGPKDFNARKKLQQLGWQPNSIRIGDRYVTYSRDSPLGALISFSADFASILNKVPHEDLADNEKSKAYMDAAFAAALTAGNMVTPELLTNGFGDILNIIDAATSSGNASERLQRVMQFKLRSLVPGIVQDIREEVDPVRRDYKPEGVFDFISSSLKDTVPFLSSSLPPQRNIWGEEMLLPTALGPDIVSPFLTTKADTSPIGKELIRLGVAGKTVLGEPPPGEDWSLFGFPKRVINDVELTNEQYSEYLKLAGGHGLKGTNGVTLKEALNKIVSDNYSMIPKGLRTDQNKRQVIKSVIRQYRNAAKQQLLLENMTIQQEFIDIQRKNGKARGVDVGF